MNRLATVAIGNSDDKLSQVEWAAFIYAVRAAVDKAVAGGGRIQFAGYSSPEGAWQNALWVVEIPLADPSLETVLRETLTELAKRYRQDSIAWWTTEQVEFLGSES